MFTVLYFLVFKNLGIDLCILDPDQYLDPKSMNPDSQYFLRPNLRVDYGFKKTNETGILLIFIWFPGGFCHKVHTEWRFSISAVRYRTSHHDGKISPGW